eukprot:s1129_g8.t1
MEADAFRRLVAYLEREEDALQALEATDLKACLRTGRGTRGHEEDAERVQYYRLYNKIRSQQNQQQKMALDLWEEKLCTGAKDHAKIMPLID